MHKLIAPAALIFLCGIGVGLSMFPYVMPHTTPQSPQIVALDQAPEAPPQPQDTAEIMVPELPTQKPLSPDDQESYVLQLFSPTSSQVSEMQDESEHLKLLEQTMMISYLLSNCELMSKQDYRKTYMALVKYLTNNGDPTPEATARAAAKRAQASYQMVYRHVPCEDPSLRQMAASLAEWRESVAPEPKQ